MVQSRAAALDPDRLPWLPAEAAAAPIRAQRPLTTPEPRRAKIGMWSPLVAWGGAVLMLTAGVSYWLGREGAAELRSPFAVPAPRETVRLPEARTTVAPPVAVEAAPPVVVTEPAIVPAPVAHSFSDRVDAPPVRRARASATAPRTPARPLARPAQASPPKAAAPKARPRPAVPHWPRPVTALYLGRMIQLGTYSTTERLEKSWAYRVQRYPQLRGLPRVVVPHKSTSGNYSYRLQVMTAAPAQSDWLCRKIRADWRSCAVLRPASTTRASG